MVITSFDNNTIKKIARLADKRYRDEDGAYVIEGLRAVRDSLPYLDSPRLVFAESAYARLSDEFRAEDAIVCSDAVFARLSQTENSQGIIAVAKKRVPRRLYASDRALFLDRIRDPGNLGTIIRSALATGFTDIYLSDCVDAYNPKVVRSAVSAISKLNLFEANTADVAELKKHGYAFLCADMDGENLFDARIPKRVCLCVGNEANGISSEVLGQADAVVSLPMENGESLNAGVCASIMTYIIRYGKNQFNTEG